MSVHLYIDINTMPLWRVDLFIFEWGLQTLFPCTVCAVSHYLTLQEHQRIRINATVSKDSEIVKIPK